MRLGRHGFAFSLFFCHRRQQYHSQQQQLFLLHKSKSKQASYALYDTNIRLTNLGRLGRVDDARNLFDEMPHRDIVSYTSMITLYINNNHLSTAENLFHSIPFTNRNIVLHSAMIHAYAKAGLMEQAHTIFHQMPTRNVYSWTSLISGHFRYGHVYEAQKLFDQMPHHIKNIVSWTTALLGYAHNGFIHQARAIFDQIPNKNVVAWTAMIKAYIQHSQTDHALQLFNAMPQRNLYSWNIMIQGFFNDNRTEEAIGLFCSMPRKNTVSWTSMVTGLGHNGCVKLARDYFNQMPEKDIAAWNAMITAYTDQGLMDEATQLFHSMPQRNIVSWNAVISGYANIKGWGSQAMKHLILLFQCSSSSIRPNESTLTCVLTSCEEDYMGLSQTHGLATRLGIVHDLSFTNALITMYAKCGDLGSAQQTFDTCETKDLVSWTAMMLAYSTHGLGAHAIENFARMLRLGYKPDEITFVGLLTACSHTGLVSKGLRFFTLMKKGFNLEPRAEHYACLVDMLGRAGELDKAFKVVLEMMHHPPPPPKDDDDAAVLGALLSACKLHGDDVLANEIGQKVIQLEPTESGGYVLLANVFAASGKWEEAAKVRRQMKEKVTSKIPGFSQVCVKGGNHVFYVGDRSHTDFNEINEMLRDKLLPEMQLKPI